MSGRVDAGCRLEPYYPRQFELWIKAAAARKRSLRGALAERRYQLTLGQFTLESLVSVVFGPFACRRRRERDTLTVSRFVATSRRRDHFPTDSMQ